MPILRPRAALFHERRISSVTFTSAHLCGITFTCGWAWPRARRFVRFWASGGAKFTKMGDSLPGTPMNLQQKFDVARLILGGEIRNRTNIGPTHKNTNKH